MVLHLRYPNAHTHWFSSLLLHLFVEVKDDCFREVITRVLLERFIVHRPHPWGALVTFIELLRNQKYEFWSKEFIRVAPEVTMLLESVSGLSDSIREPLTFRPGCEVHLSILDSLCLLLSVAHICLFGFSSLWLFLFFFFHSFRSCLSTHNSLYCNKFPPTQVLNKV